MQKKILLSALLVAAIVAPTSVRAAEMDFVVNAMPATLFIDSSGDKFKVTDQNGSSTSLSEVYTMPNIAMGLGTTWRDVYVDVVGGGGILINDGFRSYMLQGIIEAGWEASDSLDIGPRLGVIYFVDPEWLEDDSVDFDDQAGLLLGIQMALGDKIKYLVSVDFINAAFDVQGADVGVNSSDDKLKLSGIAIQFGVRGEF